MIAQPRGGTRPLHGGVCPPDFTPGISSRDLSDLFSSRIYLFFIYYSFFLHSEASIHERVCHLLKTFKFFFFPRITLHDLVLGGFRR